MKGMAIAACVIGAVTLIILDKPNWEWMAVLAFLLALF